MPEKNDIVTDVCKRCVIGVISVFKRDERGAQVMRERNGRGCERPRPFSVIAIWAGIVLAKCRGRTVPSAQVSGGIGIMLVCWGSEQLAHDEWGGSSFLFRKAFSSSRKWGGITATVSVAAQSCV